MTKILLSRPRQELRRDAAYSHAWRTADDLLLRVALLHIGINRRDGDKPTNESHEAVIARRMENVENGWTDFFDAAGLLNLSTEEMVERLRIAGDSDNHTAAAVECIAQLPDRLAAHNEAVRNPSIKTRPKQWLATQRKRAEAPAASLGQNHD